MSTASSLVTPLRWFPAPHLTDWQRFLLVSLLPVILGTVGIGLWVSTEIERGVVHQAGSFTSLSVTSFVEPMVQDLMNPETSDKSRVALDRVLHRTALSQQLVRVVIWGRDRQQRYESRPALPGGTGDAAGFQRALRGWVAAETVASPEGVRWLHTFGPVREPGSDEVLAVVEFFQPLDQFESRLATARQNSWMVVGLAMFLVYVVLGFLVRPSYATVRAQQAKMAEQLADLRTLLSQNRSLSRRVQEASQRAATTHEQLLRRVGAELHDGPAQDISLALLRLEARDKEPLGADHELVKAALENALKEIRSLSAGLSLPELDNLTLAQTAAKAIQAHERRTRTAVVFHDRTQGGEAPSATKIAVYRVIQESLNNAFRHAGGKNQVVRLERSGRRWELVVSDDGGTGPEEHAQDAVEEHLGVSGMRERVESLGGTFDLERCPGVGTVVRAWLPEDATQEEA